MKIKVNRGFINIITMVLFFLGLGVLTANLVSANANTNSCYEEENESTGCFNDLYMGGKWVGGTVPVVLTNLGDANIKTKMRSAITHFNSSQTYLNIYETTSYPIEKGYIKATDDHYYFETWTATAAGSWQGGWPIDINYNDMKPINIKFNLVNFFDGTDFQETGTARHELGHSIGLGHKTSQYTLMYCNRSRYYNTLTNADKETFISLLNK
ncbi:MAG: hypothetical protein R3353_06250 [Salegentibacter mishustinae]|nr:hypothetical protein [Salegentibacter mishustinae]